MEITSKQVKHYKFIGLVIYYKRFIVLVINLIFKNSIYLFNYKILPSLPLNRYYNHKIKIFHFMNFGLLSMSRISH